MISDDDLFTAIKKNAEEATVLSTELVNRFSKKILSLKQVGDFRGAREFIETLNLPDCAGKTKLISLVGWPQDHKYYECKEYKYE